MPRSMQEILDHAEELATKFEEYEPAEGDRKDATALRSLRAAVLTQADAERAVAAAVAAARNAGHSWSSIGAMVGTSGEAARQRYASGERRATHGTMVGAVREYARPTRTAAKAAKAPAVKAAKRSAPAVRKGERIAAKKPVRSKG